jgi:hypothetical protein
MSRACMCSSGSYTHIPSYYRRYVPINNIHLLLDLGGVLRHERERTSLPIPSQPWYLTYALLACLLQPYYLK